MFSGIAVISSLLGLYSAHCCPLYDTFLEGPLGCSRERGLGGRAPAHGFNQAASGMRHQGDTARLLIFPFTPFYYKILSSPSSLAKEMLL